MKVFRRVILTLLTLTFTYHSAAAAAEAELRSILSKHWEAMGGISNWSKVESIRLNGTIERDGQIVDIVIIKKRPNQIRATVTLPLPGSEDEKLQVIRAHDGETAWTATRLAGAPEMRKEELPQEAAEELLADAGVLPPLIRLWQEGAEIELLEPTTIKNESAFRLSVTTKTNKKYTFHLSAESHQLLSYDSIDSEGEVTHTTLAEYTKVSGVIIPTRSNVDSPKTGRSILTTHSIEVGVGIYREYFKSGKPLQTVQAD